MNDHDSGCLINTRIRPNNDFAFSGPLHFASALFVFCAVLFAFPTFVEAISGSSSALVPFVILILGFSLIPDLDNTQSTAKSAVAGGGILSEVFQLTSLMWQQLVHTRRDDDLNNPHRKLWHTPFCWLVVAVLVTFLSSTHLFQFSTPSFWKLPSYSFNSGKLIIFLLLFLAAQVALAGIEKTILSSKKKSLGLTILKTVLAAGIGFLGVLNLPSNMSTLWVGIGVLAGAWIHILGDWFTTQGVPLLHPIPYKGRMWWMFRLTKIKSGGALEPILSAVFIVVSVLLIIITCFPHH